MPAEEINRHLTADPFVPFRLHLSDGRVFEVRRRELLWVGHRVGILLILEPGPGRVLERYETFALVHVVSIAPEAASQAG